MSRDHERKLRKPREKVEKTTRESWENHERKVGKPEGQKKAYKFKETRKKIHTAKLGKFLLREEVSTEKYV